jgi:phosphate transport system substrate-binding protein
VRKHILAPAAFAAAGLLLLSACASGEDTSAPAPAPAPAENGGEAAAQLSGTISIDGSSTVGPFAEAAAELFMDSVGGSVLVTVAVSGTGGGFEKFCNGETDGSNASRDIKEDEAARCAEAGIGFGRLSVANDALSVIVNKDNPLECISLEALNAIWKSGSTVRTWGDIPGVDAGELASEAVVLYGPGTDSGTFDFFTEEINGESGNIITPYNNIGEDDNQAVVGVSGGKGAMAFIPYSFYQEYSDQVKGLQIDNGDGCVAPEVENLIAGTYTPLGRTLYMFPSAAALERPEVLAFYTFVIENNDEIAQAAGLVPLTQAQREEQLAVVAGLGG